MRGVGGVLRIYHELGRAEKRRRSLIFGARASGYWEITIAAVCDKVILTLETRLVSGLNV
jgi:hypothetical protein